MKTAIYILLVLAIAIVGYNFTKLNFDHLLQGDSSIAMVGVLSGLCAVLALSILLIAKKIAAKVKQ